MILDDDPDAHLRHIKLQPKVEPEVGGCVEHGDGALARELEDDFDYEGVQTCAVDGMCQTACPVLINTGDLVKRLRRDGNGRVADAAWDSAARRWIGAAVACQVHVPVDWGCRGPYPRCHRPRLVQPDLRARDGPRHRPQLSTPARTAGKSDPALMAWISRSGRRGR